MKDKSCQIKEREISAQQNPDKDAMIFKSQNTKRKVFLGRMDIPYRLIFLNVPKDLCREIYRVSQRIDREILNPKHVEKLILTSRT